MDDEEHDGVQPSRVLGLSASDQLKVQPSLHILLRKSVTTGNTSNRLACCRLSKVFFGFLNHEVWQAGGLKKQPFWFHGPHLVHVFILQSGLIFLLKQYSNNDTCRLPNLSRIDVSYPAVQPSNLRSAALWWDGWEIWIGEISFIPVLQERLRQPNVVLLRWILIHLCLCCALSISRQVL